MMYWKEDKHWIFIAEKKGCPNMDLLPLPLPFLFIFEFTQQISEQSTD